MKKRPVPPPSASKAAEESKQKRHIKMKKVQHDEVNDIVLWWLTQYVENYPHLFCEVGTTLSLWIIKASCLYFGAIQLQGSGK